MELLKLMSDRYTCRRYSEENIKEEDLNKILEAGRVAPSREIGRASCRERV